MNRKKRVFATLTQSEYELLNPEGDIADFRPELLYLCEDILSERDDSDEIYNIRYVEPRLGKRPRGSNRVRFDVYVSSIKTPKLLRYIKKMHPLPASLLMRFLLNLEISKKDLQSKEEAAPIAEEDHDAAIETFSAFADSSEPL